MRSKKWITHPGARGVNSSDPEVIMALGELAAASMNGRAGTHAMIRGGAQGLKLRIMGDATGGSRGGPKRVVAMRAWNWHHDKRIA
jgi:hypothetical protein